MLLYLTIVFLFFYNTNAHGIIMDFTLNTILGDSDCATLLARSLFFVSRGNQKRLALGGTCGDRTANGMERKTDTDACVVSFHERTSKKRGNKLLGSGLFSVVKHRDSLVVLENQNRQQHLKHIDDDDETASTVDMDEDEFPVAASSSSNHREKKERRSVQFEEELVTAVYTRPRTTKEDKYYLHYDEYDYMDFKLEYRDQLLQQRDRERNSKGRISNQQQQLPCYRRSPRKVSFKREVVESVHPVMDRSQRKKIQKDLFYTEEEMRTFLDEFVVSLQKQQQQQQQVVVTS
ncbi:unnamed protein product [Pseudo-nitzschia multistriata]|uniref:Uncharacterized protein n=1 Tax=Pseudo-nitzschia multistriata TaxID=183589 RepID=A0A448ZNR9_9STRA|nr:unnamed protein product [Pseudo-nitzschia multistriata]